MTIQLLNKSFSRSSTLKKIFLNYYTAYALNYPERNKDYIKRTVKKILACRTEATGCRVYKCPKHSIFYILPHSCGNRFCTVCSSFRTQIWVSEKLSFLTSINTPYCFMTFTVHGPISRIIQENKEALLGRMFYASAHSLLHWCQKHKNFTPGIMMILHTSGDQLNYHVHIHLLITCGGLRRNEAQPAWIALKPKKLKKRRNGKKFHPVFPPETITKTFKALLYRALRKAYHSEGFSIPVEYKDNASTFKDFNKLLKAWWKLHWNIDMSDPLHNTKEILGYIARYVKKPPISNRRIIEHNETFVKFSVKDRNSRSRKRRKTMIYPTEYFMMCLTEHVPLERFPMMRWYGIFANRNKNQLIPIVQQLIPGESSGEAEPKKKAISLWRESHKEKHGTDPLTCPICGRELELTAAFYPNQLTAMKISFEELPTFLVN